MEWRIGVVILGPGICVWRSWLDSSISCGQEERRFVTICAMFEREYERLVFLRELEIACISLNQVPRTVASCLGIASEVIAICHYVFALKAETLRHDVFRSLLSALATRCCQRSFGNPCVVWCGVWAVCNLFCSTMSRTPRSTS